MSYRLEITTECDVDTPWEELERREGGRFCGHCQKLVVDLRHVTEREARRRFEEAGGELCAWVYEDAEGAAVFRHEAPSRRGLGAVVIGAALAAACGVETSEPTPVDPPAAQDEPEPAPPAPEHPVEVAEPEEAAPEEVVEPVGDADDGAEHPAHPGDVHTAVHTRHHGRRGGVGRRFEDPVAGDPDDPLQGI